VSYRAPNWRTIVITAVAALLAAALLAFSRPVEILVDGRRVDSDVAPVTTVSDKVFVPLRSFARALGASTRVDEKTGRVEVVRGAQSLRIKIADTHASVNGVAVILKHAPFRVRGRVMIGLSVVADAFGVRVRYDPRTARVEAITPRTAPSPAPSSS
jgi:uncharacterized membrane protein YqiK